LALTSLRIDKLLWHLRLTKSRGLAQALIAAGHVHLNGKRVEKSSVEVKAGDSVTIPKGDGAFAFQLITIPLHRGPAAEAQACYREI
jgi:ribosome-associated heat shock protein Hsp15